MTIKRWREDLDQKLRALIAGSKLVEPFQMAQAIEALGYPHRTREKRAQTLVGHALRRLGYVRTRRRVGNKKAWVWTTPERGVLP